VPSVLSGKRSSNLLAITDHGEPSLHEKDDFLGFPWFTLPGLWWDMCDFGLGLMML
jgi:hypothetical protein